jgi:hypothetical protein
LELKVTNPKDYDDILKEIKKGKIKKGDLNVQFADKNISHTLDVMAREGLLTRTYTEVDGKHMIQLEYSGKPVKFKQGRKNYPKVKGGVVI